MSHTKSELNAFVTANEKLLEGKLTRFERQSIESFIRRLDKAIDEKECMEITCKY